MKGQLSAEMLILLMLIIGLVVIVYTQMNKTVTSVAGTVEKNTATVTTAGEARISCSKPEDCTPYNYKNCEEGICK